MQTRMFKRNRPGMVSEQAWVMSEDYERRALLIVDKHCTHIFTTSIPLLMHRISTICTTSIILIVYIRTYQYQILYDSVVK